MKRETTEVRRDQIPGGPARRLLPSTEPILSGAIADLTSSGPLSLRGRPHR